MNYEETIQYLYNSAPLFQNIGSGAYKEGLSNTLALDEHFEHPHKQYKTIHVAGTNGKGSCAHTLAAFLQLSGLKVGLYTSPHLVDFRERIRVNSRMIPEQYVVDFVEKERGFFEPLHPSFFELTTALAFKYFAEMNVDIAVIEVGLGGRLDCTNIITPCLSVITNISLDHTQLLGSTLEQIAHEKAGIIKENVPVVVGEVLPETRKVFGDKAASCNAPVIFAEESPEIAESHLNTDGTRHYTTQHWGEFDGVLSGECQTKNANTILHAFAELSRLNILPAAGKLKKTAQSAFMKVCELTGLMGRWQYVQRSPDVVCDTGHNVGGWKYLAHQLSEGSYKNVHVVFGMMKDKDVDTVLCLLPKNAHYYFTRASVERSLNEKELLAKAEGHGLKGESYPNPNSAYEAALSQAFADDLIYIGGSSFIVADFLTSHKEFTY